MHTPVSFRGKAGISQQQNSNSERRLLLLQRVNNAMQNGFEVLILSDHLDNLLPVKIEPLGLCHPTVLAPLNQEPDCAAGETSSRDKAHGPPIRQGQLTPRN